MRELVKTNADSWCPEALARSRPGKCQGSRRLLEPASTSTCARKNSCDSPSDYPRESGHQPKIGLVSQVQEIKKGKSTQAIPHQESTNPSQEALFLHPEIRDLTEMTNRKSFSGTLLVNCRYPLLVRKHLPAYSHNYSCNDKTVGRIKW